MNVEHERRRLDAEYRAMGVDVDGINRQFAEAKKSLNQAIANVKSRKMLWGILYSPYLGFGRLKPEVKEEWDRLRGKR